MSSVFGESFYNGKDTTTHIIDGTFVCNESSHPAKETYFQGAQSSEQTDSGVFARMLGVDFELQPTIMIDAYNAESRRLQQNAGIEDTSQCLTVAEIDNSRRTSEGHTSLADMFAGLKRREFLTPKSGGDINYGRIHDELVHFETIRTLHPDLVDVVVAAAEAGEAALQLPGGRVTAEAIATNIDLVLVYQYAAELGLSESVEIYLRDVLAVNPKFAQASEAELAEEAKRLIGLQRIHSLIMGLPVSRPRSIFDTLDRFATDKSFVSKELDSDLCPRTYVYSNAPDKRHLNKESSPFPKYTTII